MTKTRKACCMKCEGFFVIFGGFLVHLSLGSFYTYGNIQPYLVKYMQNYSLSGSSVNPGNSVWIFGLTLFGMGTAVSAGGFLDSKIGPCLTVLIGGWFYCLNVCLTYFTIKSYLVVIILSDGLLAGVGMGIAYGVALATPCKWYPDRKGFVIGIIVAGFGLSATIFDFLQTFYINHNGDSEIRQMENVPRSYYVLGLTYAALVGVGSIFLKNPPNEGETEKFNDVFEGSYSPQINALLNNMRSSNIENINRRPHELFFEFDFWILWITFSLNAACVVLLMPLYKGFGLKLNLTDKSPYPYLTIGSIVGALMNCVGRVFWGFINDKTSYKTTMLIVTISTAIMYPTFYACSVIGNLKVPDDNLRLVFYLVWFVALNFLLSGSFTLFPAVCANLFGMKHAIANYGLLFTSASFGGTMTSIITTSIWAGHRNDIKMYSYAFIAGGLMSILAAGLTILFRGKSLLNYRF